jgi:hypothetical protein
MKPHAPLLADGRSARQVDRVEDEARRIANEKSDADQLLREISAKRSDAIVVTAMIGTRIVRLT